ncbi:hypothetical protein DPX16_11258 [Anabarilius grahami]|uniref:Uncharacterized protein n=1 Tax=Anabarilius grahami TaxID=495550 RepID=A0A3N0Z5A5_ANAGA|nr:hypothetical protein DPX16_11258 [Anabarilius grahami]
MTSELEEQGAAAVVHLEESHNWMTSELEEQGAAAVVHLEESHNWSLGKQGVPTSLNDAKINQESITTTETAPLQRPEETTLVHLKESNDRMTSELEEQGAAAVVHLEESHNCQSRVNHNDGNCTTPATRENNSCPPQRVK